MIWSKDHGCWKQAIRARQTLRVFLLVIPLIAIAGISAVRADIPLELGNDIRIEAAVATPTKKGELSRLRFRIVNGSTAAIHVTGIDTPVAQGAKLVARIGETETTSLESIGVPAGEILDLTTSHLWYEIGPVMRDLRVGETFEMTLSFVGWQLVVPVHVHRAS